MEWFWVGPPVNVPPDGGGMCGGLLIGLICSGESESSGFLTPRVALNLKAFGNTDSEGKMRLYGHGVRKFYGTSESIGTLSLSIDSSNFVIYDPAA